MVKVYGLDASAVSAEIPYVKTAPFMNAAEFTKRMKRCHLVLWLNTKRERLEPGILCTNLETALFVRGALRDLRACPCCDNPFLPNRPDQTYCSLRCRERHRKRRERARSKKKGAH